MNIDYKEVINSIITSIDLINPILKDHHRRVTAIAYLIGKELDLTDRQFTNLILASSVHDIGALTVKDSLQLKKMDVKNPEPHSILGAKMLFPYHSFIDIATIVRYHHINFFDYIPKLPYESLIIHMADRIEISLDMSKGAINQRDIVRKKIYSLSGSKFSPELVDLFLKLSKKEAFWLDIDNLTMHELLSKIKISNIIEEQSFTELEGLLQTFSRIIDYKSSCTASHSIGVAHVAFALAQYCNYPKEKCEELKIAGYLHDLGKIAVKSEIINKPSKLNYEEFISMKAHVYYTKRILKNIKGFESITKWASAHHEKLDGSGYPNKLSGTQLSQEIKILAYSDIFTSLCEDRPYRKAMEPYEAIEIIAREYKNLLGDTIFNILVSNVTEINRIRKKIQEEVYINYSQLVPISS